MFPLETKNTTNVMQKIMKSKDNIEAIIACSDKVTTNIMRYCNLKKIIIPERLALIGFSNLDFTELLSPSLSVIALCKTGQAARISSKQSLLSMVRDRYPRHLWGGPSLLFDKALLHRLAAHKIGSCPLFLV